MTGAKKVDPTQGLLLVLCGPSGVGKTSVARKLLERPAFVKVTTCTTRKPRGGEQDGRDYFFYTRPQFEEKVSRGDLLEHAEVHGELYGTPREDIHRKLDAGKIVILDIDVQGARSIRQTGLPTFLLFLEPPSWDELKKRIEGRKTESAEAIRKRLQTAEREMKEKDWFDRVIVNDDLDRVVQAVVSELRKAGRAL